DAAAGGGGQLTPRPQRAYPMARRIGGLQRMPNAVTCAAGFAFALAPGAVWGAEFMSTSDAATILYDAPSARAKPLFVLGRDTPLEVIVPVEGWTKVRDA